jgi:type I restriction-modification system DNA methylase subunit
MSIEPRDDVLIGLGDIAGAAHVTPAAVSNWRSRHEDFPTPRQTSGASDLFSLREVEAWLVENGKIAQPIPPSIVLWGAADVLRGVWDLSEISRFLVATLVYGEVCELSGRPDAAHQFEVPEDAEWGRLTGSDEGLHERLVAGARLLEHANPTLDGLLVPGLDQQPRLDDARAATLVRSLDAVRRDEVLGAADLFHELMDRRDSANRFAQEYGTPGDLAELMVRLVRPQEGTIVDPAVGRGHLLMLAGLQATGNPELLGFDLNEDALIWARSWAVIYDLPAELHLADALRLPEEHFGSAQTVVLDPPLGLADWGDAELYLDPRWRFGPPPPSSADFAWLQLAINLLASGGRAVVAAPAGTLFRGGREQAIRRSLLDANVVEAIVQLPGRMRRDTGIPLALWVLRPAVSASADPREVLLLDATRLGTPGKSHHQLDEDDIASLASVVHVHRGGERVPPTEHGIVVAVDELDEADLTPKRYLAQAVEVDVGQLKRDAANLRAQLRTATRELPALLRAALDDDQGGGR